MNTDIQNLAARIQKGDQEAFREFFDAYFERIYRFLLTILKNPQDAEDVTSLAFMYVWDNREKLQDPGLIVSWLYQVAKHRAFDQIRKNKAKDVVALEGVAEFIADESDSPEASAENYFKGRVVEQFLGQLSAEERMLVHLRFAEDLEFKEIAHRVGSSTIAVRVRVHRIVKKMQKLAGENDPSEDSKKTAIYPKHIL